MTPSQSLLCHTGTTIESMDVLYIQPRLCKHLTQDNFNTVIAIQLIQKLFTGQNFAQATSTSGDPYTTTHLMVTPPLTGECPHFYMSNAYVCTCNGKIV